MVAQGRRIAEGQLAESEARPAGSLVAVAAQVVASSSHLELAGDVGQVDEHRRIGVAKAHDVQQELLVVGVSNHLVVPQACVADGVRTHAATGSGPEDEEDDGPSSQLAPGLHAPSPSFHGTLPNPESRTAPQDSGARHPQTSHPELSSTNPANLTKPTIPNRPGLCRQDQGEPEPGGPRSPLGGWARKKANGKANGNNMR